MLKAARDVKEGSSSRKKSKVAFVPEALKLPTYKPDMVTKMR